MNVAVVINILLMLMILSELLIGLVVAAPVIWRRKPRFRVLKRANFKVTP